MPWGAAIAAVGALGAAKMNSDASKDAAKKNSPTNQANAQANANHVNQYTPYGSSEWAITGKNPDGTNQYSNYQNLAPAQQQQLDQQNQQNASLGQAGSNLAAQVNGQYSTPIDASGTGAINYGVTADQQADYSNNLKYSSGVTQDQLNNDLQAQRDSVYKQQQSFLDPQWQQQQQQLQTQLANSGVVQNSDAYNQAMENFNRQREFAYGNARQQAIQAGGAEQSRLQQMGLNEANLNNSTLNNQFVNTLANAQQNNAAQSQAMQQLFSLRNQPMNELNSLRTASQVNDPNFSNTTQQPFNMGAAMQNNYSNQVANANNNAQGISNLANIAGNINWGSLFNVGGQTDAQKMSALQYGAQNDINNMPANGY
jgi:hypothetical protein